MHTPPTAEPHTHRNAARSPEQRQQGTALESMQQHQTTNKRNKGNAAHAHSRIALKNDQGGTAAHAPQRRLNARSLNSIPSWIGVGSSYWCGYRLCTPYHYLCTLVPIYICNFSYTYYVSCRLLAPIISHYYTAILTQFHTKFVPLQRELPCPWSRVQSEANWDPGC